jgi:YggT family protein
MSLNLVLILDSLFNVLYFILLARIILSWFPIRPGGIMQDVIEVLYSITEPILAPIRRLVPPIAMGGGYLDLSTLIVLLLLRLIRGMLF